MRFAFVVFAVLLSACIQAGMGDRGSYPPRGPVSIEAEYCELGAQNVAPQIREQLLDAAGRKSSPARSNADLVAAMRAVTPDAHVERAEEWTWKTTPSSPEGGELARRLNGVAFLRVRMADMAHSTQAELLQKAMKQRLEELYDAETFSPDGEREGARRALTCVHHFEAVEAMLVATLAAFVDGAAGDPSTIDAAIDAALAAQPAPRPATDAELAALWSLAQAKALDLDAEFRRALEHGHFESEAERLQLLGILKPNAQLNVPDDTPRAVASGDAPKDDRERAEVTAALVGLARGDVVGFVKCARFLLPKDSKLRVGVEAADALRRGDVDAALANAHTLAPADPSVAKVLAAADKANATAKSVRAAAR